MHNYRFQIFACLLLAILVTLPFPAYANAGIPMIFLTFPAMLIALLPIVFIEAVVINRTIAIPFRKIFIPCGIANAVSTIIGFPLAWSLLLGLELLTIRGNCGPGFETFLSSITTAIFESAWLCVWEKQLHWMIPVAFINCLIVAFFISVLVEYFVFRKLLVGQEISNIKKATYKSNLMTYSLLIVLNLAYLGYNIADQS